MFIMFTTVLQIMILYKLPSARGDVDMGHLKKFEYAMSYLDETGSDTNDLFFDRLMALYFNLKNNKTFTEQDIKLKVVTTAVLLDKNRGLTSYTPFRRYMLDKYVKSITAGAVLRGRTRLKNGTFEKFFLYKALTCARQIVYYPDEDVKSNQWFGPEDDPNKHSPTHDLMIFRLEGEVARCNLLPEDYTMEKVYPFDVQTAKASIGAFVTEIAQPGDRFRAPFKFASLAHKDKKHIAAWNYLESSVYTENHDAIVDCGKWLNREFGHFICIKNVNNEIALGSGAMLYSNNTLFGVGSFMISRGKMGILVFTDVRPYYEHIMNGCTELETKKKV